MAKTKRQNASILPVLIIFFVLISIVGAGIFFSRQEVFGTGLSIASTNYDSNDPELAGAFWSMNVVQDGSSGNAFGSFVPSQVVDAADNVVAEKPFTISLTMTENKALYDITKINAELYSYSITYRSAGFFSKQCAELVPPGNARFYASINLPSSLDNLCVWRTTDGVFGVIDKNRITFKTRIDVSVDGKAQYSGILSSEQVSASIVSASGASLGRAKWAGSLSSLVALPQPSGRSVCAFFGNSWITSDCEAKQAWQLKDSSLLYDLANPETYRGRTGNSATYQSETLSLANSRVVTPLQALNSNIRAGKPFMLAGGDGQQAVAESSSGVKGLTSGTSDSGKIIFDLGTSQYHYPLINIKLSANKVTGLGFFEPVGKPEVSCSGSEDVSSGSYGSVTVNVKNAGTVAASFDVTAVCPAPFSSQDTRRISGLSPGASRSVSLLVTADLNQDASSKCTITARDVNKGSISDSCEQSVEGSAAIVKCKDGDKRAVGALIQACNNNAWVTVEDCAAQGKTADAAKLECTVATGGGSGGKVTPDYCKLPVIKSVVPKCLGFFNSIALIVAVAAGIISFAVLYGFTSARLSSGLSLMLSSVLGLLVFAFTLTYIWVAVVGVVLAIIIGFVIRGTGAGRLAGRMIKP